MCVVVLVLYHLIVGVLRGRRMFRALSVMELTAGLLFTGGAVVVAALGGGSGIVVLAIYTGANLATALAFGAAALWLVWREPQVPAAPDPPGGMRSLLIFGFWAGWAAFSWQLLMSLPAIEASRGRAEVGSGRTGRAPPAAQRIRRPHWPMPSSPGPVAVLPG